MKKNLFLIFVVLLAYNCLYSQVKYEAIPQAAYLSGGLWHFIDSEGKELFPPKKLMNVLGYSEGFYRVKFISDDIEKWGFLDSNGELVFEIECFRAFDFSGGMAMVIKEDKYNKSDKYYGFVNKKGVLTIPYQFTDAMSFSEGMAYARLKEKRGYIDSSGKWALVLDTIVANSFNEGLASVNNPGLKCGYIDKKGNIVIGLKYDEVGDFSEGTAFFHAEGYAGYINKKGDTVIKPRFWDGKPFKEGRAFVGKFLPSKMILWGLVDIEDSLLMDFQFTEVRNFSQGLAAVKKNEHWGFINREGKYVILSEFRTAGSFYNGICWASKIENGVEKYGFINYKGEFVFEISKPDKVFDFGINYRVY